MRKNKGRAIRPAFAVSLSANLLDAGDAARNLDRLAAGQRLDVAIRHGDEAAARAEIHSLAGPDRQFGLAATLGDDQRARLAVEIDRARSLRRCSSSQHGERGDKGLQHFSPGGSHRLCCRALALFGDLIGEAI
jgi:hypothetical protein